MTQRGSMNLFRLSLAALLVLPLVLLSLVNPRGADGMAGADGVAPTGPGAGALGEPVAPSLSGPDLAGSWLWPLAPPHPVLRSFQAPATVYSPGHRGLDLVAAPGLEVLSPADGVVSFAGVVVDRPLLSIEHSDGLVSSFEPVSAGVAVGDRVTAGQTVGQVADGGHCAGRCLHFGARLHGGYVTPLLYLVGVPRAVLLPPPP